MAYTNFQNCTKAQYEEIIYSGGAKNKIKIYFNNVDLETIMGEEADYYCEKLTKIDRILPNDGGERFSLDNFIATELTLVLHNVDIEDIEDQVRIEIGTVVDSNSLGDIYEWVPLGIFNIQDTPTTDKDKITIKLRDNTVKFDFYYNGKTLIDNNGGSATKLQILNDICTQAGVTNNVSSFPASSELIGTYDNTIKARTYVSYLAEQAGCIAKINRSGELIFVRLKNSISQSVPLSIVEKYEIGEEFNVERVVYEDGIRKYQKNTNEELITLYINSANPYILDATGNTRMSQIYNELKSVYITSATTGKILGNPAIDSYDLLEIYDDTQLSLPTIFITLANNTFTYKGNMIAEYSTVIGEEARKENVTLNSEQAFQKYARTSIDAVKGEVLIQAGRIDTANNDINTVQLRLNDAETRIDVVSTNIDEDTGDIQSVRTTKGYTFDADGLKISSEEDTFNSLSNNKGTFYKDGDIILSQFTKDNMIIKDMVLYGKYYYGVPEDLVVENFTKEDAMFVAERFTNNDNEECFGHFWNMED